MFHIETEPKHFILDLNRVDHEKKLILTTKQFSSDETPYSVNHEESFDGMTTEGLGYFEIKDETFFNSSTKCRFQGSYEVNYYAYTSLQHGHYSSDDELVSILHHRQST